MKDSFNPLRLFSAGEKGAWYDPSDLSTMFQNSNGTTAVAVGDRVGYIADKSGNGIHATQSTDSKRPILRQGAASEYYLEFDGATEKRCFEANLDLTSTDELTVFAGVKSNVGLNALANVVEFSDNIGGNDGTFRLTAQSGGDDIYDYRSKGTNTAVGSTPADYTPPLTNILTGKSKISTDLLSLRVDGVEKATSSANQGTGNYGSYELNIGARNADNPATPWDGNIYSIIIRGKVSSDEEIESTEAYVAQQTGISI